MYYDRGLNYSAKSCSTWILHFRPIMTHTRHVMAHISWSCLPELPERAVWNCQLLNTSTHYFGAEIAQSVQRLPMGWTLRGSNPGGGISFRSRPDRLWGPNSHLNNEYWTPFPGVKRPGRGVDLPTHLVPRLKKEYNGTSTPLWVFVSCCRLNLNPDI